MATSSAVTISIGLQLMFIISIVGQQQNELFSNPSQIPKTNFQCKGRPAGYYADVEAGCQTYHMCDGLGRQFSYTCPNTTLFQQRMLICDHWYMVNCSKAESNYGANLLIGQRDKPFVSDDEHDVRTPRPDLFERSYASGFAGETFRKTISPLLNSIQSFDKNSAHHKTFNERGAGKTNVKPFGGHAVHSLQASASSYPTPPPQPSLPPQPTQFQPNFQQQPQRFDNSQTSFSSGGSDLRTSSSQDGRRSQNENVFETDDKPSHQQKQQQQHNHHQQKVQTPKPLLIEFEPPFLQPIYNTETTATPLSPSTNAPQTAPTRPRFVQPSPTTPVPAFAQPTFNSFASANQPVASSRVSNFGDRLPPSSATITTTTTTVAPTPTTITTTEGQLFAQPTEFPFSSNENDLIPVLGDDNAITGTGSSNTGNIKEPPTVLLPPYESSVTAGIPTTQGPRVYHEWKLPASDLEPPIDENKSNGAITIPDDDNQIPVLPPQTTPSDALLVPPLFDQSESNNINSNVKLPSLSLQPPAYSPQVSNNNTDHQSAATNHSFPSFSALNNVPNGFPQSTDKTQTQRSISPASAGPANSLASSSSSKRQSSSAETTTHKEINYLDLKKQFLIPEYTFPLENIERPSYTESNAVNSFQIKIPDEIVHSQELVSDGSSKKEVHRKPWYGENAKCPECHPTFLKPGSCEPCIKIR